MQRMLSMHDLKPQDLQGLSQEAVTALAAQMLEHIRHQASGLQSKDHELELQQKLLQRKDRDIAWRDAKIEKITFELTRLKRWKFGAKNEAMTADQRQMFQDTLLEDEADLEAQLAALQAALPKTPAKAKQAPRRPRRQALPAHLRRIEHHHEPEDTSCTIADCGQPMTRVRRGHQRTAGHRAGRVLRAPPHLRQVDLPLLPAPRHRAPGAGAGRSADHRMAASPPAGWWHTR